MNTKIMLAAMALTLATPGFAQDDIQKDSST